MLVRNSWQIIHSSKDKIWKERCRFSKFYQILPSVVLNVLKEFDDSLFPLKIYCLIHSYQNQQVPYVARREQLKEFEKLTDTVWNCWDMLGRTRCINLPSPNEHTNLLTRCPAHNPNILVCPMGHLLVDSFWEQMVLATVAPKVLRGGERWLSPPQHDWRWRKMMCWMIGLFCFWLREAQTVTKLKMLKERENQRTKDAVKLDYRFHGMSYKWKAKMKD